MKGIARISWGVLGAALVVAGCGPGSEPVPPAPVTPQATVLIEPPRVEVGRVATVVIAVATPPEHHVVPLASPGEVPGVWLLDWRTEPVIEEPTRWLHSTRVRIRGRTPGPHVWPALRVEVEGPEGARHALETEPVPFEVISTADAAERDAPYPLRALPAPRGLGALVLAALAGALATLAAVGAIALARRTQPPGPVTAEDTAPGRAPVAAWQEAMQRLESLRERAAHDPHEAAAQAAIALRRYVSGRFGVGLEARTTEELAAARAPLSLATRWRALVCVLAALDAVRFRSADRVRESDALRRPLDGALEEAVRFVRETRPQEARP